jgi:hypothetical protein
MATDWTPEMEAQLEQFKRDLIDVIESQVNVIRREARETERRLSEQHRDSVKEVQGQVQLLGESFGGTLDAINRRIQRLEENVGTTLKDHARILNLHSHQIDELNRRSGH